MDTLSRILIIIIFVVMFVVITIGKVHRYLPAIIGAGLTILVLFFIFRDSQAVVSVLNLSEITGVKFWIPGQAHLESHGINWQTIFFIIGMMIMVEGLAIVGFFRWMCLFLAKIVNYKVISIFITFMLLSGFLSMFIDSITVMLFLATVTIEIARLLRIDPVPLIIAEIFSSNIGGSATMSGDPPNIIIGTSLGFTFIDFVQNLGWIALLGLFLALVYFLIVFRKQLSTRQPGVENISKIVYPQPAAAITDSRMFLWHSGILVVTVVLLITHAMTGISVALIGIISAVLTLLVAHKEAFSIVKKIDWRTMLFFIGLFICVGGLEETGVLSLLAGYIGHLSGGNLIVVISIILWFSAFASAVVDNIPFAATMVPVISQLSLTLGLDLHPLAWSLALGTDIGGNGTPIGASANVVGTAIAEKEGYPVSWGKYLKYCFPAMILVIGLCNLLLFLKY